MYFPLICVCRTDLGPVSLQYCVILHPKPGLWFNIQSVTFNLADFMAESELCVVSVVDTGQCQCYIVWELPLLLAVTFPVPEELPSNDVTYTERSFFFF